MNKKINLQDETFLKTDQVAKLFQVGISTVKKWRSEKILK